MRTTMAILEPLPEGKSLLAGVLTELERPKLLRATTTRDAAEILGAVRVDIAGFALQLVRVRNDTQPFNESRAYIGSDRKRMSDPAYVGVERRHAKTALYVAFRQTESGCRR